MLSLNLDSKVFTMDIKIKQLGFWNLTPVFYLWSDYRLIIKFVFIIVQGGGSLDNIHIHNQVTSTISFLFLGLRISTSNSPNS